MSDTHAYEQPPHGDDILAALTRAEVCDLIENDMSATSLTARERLLALRALRFLADMCHRRIDSSAPVEKFALEGARADLRQLADKFGGPLE